MNYSSAFTAGLLAVAFAGLAYGQGATPDRSLAPAKGAPGTSDAPPEFRQFEFPSAERRRLEPRSFEEVTESCRRDTACKAKLDALPRNRSSLEYFGITEARAQTPSTFIILTPCNPPEIHVPGARAYWFTNGGFQMNCPGSTHSLYRHWLGPTGDGPWVTAVIVAPTAEYYLFDVAYQMRTEQTCPNTNPAIPPLSTYLEMWDGSAYTTQASWTDDPCLQPPHRTALVQLSAGWNYLKFRVRYVANQPGYASFMGFTFYECQRPPFCISGPVPR